MPKVELINPGFSIADAEYPELQLIQGVLHLRFKDWKEQQVAVEFHEVFAFSWQEAEQSLLDDEPYDGVCEIHESELKARHESVGSIPHGQPSRHLRFNFNACGQLEVLCASFTVCT